ncbi:glycoside hydrolase family 3 C-terminal domain-containing protein [Bacillus paramycoides]|uniref:Glycoside hydrolase family 3 C-terminal domain-containing protein n=1 Tax=Bacillus paramycoides TaxID=2026194 RepID=A0ABU6MZK6_9BACI|nr:glycoside hydrolase family 3 C-terminal domain-containing protein [Bacillus paramycoides]MED0982131.1 glycoside hydrolase family 3 C-terminal domain-containing protein [Bacillus paramycoides]MED0984399.1 glycoside hydrolase family 3 C-terminal domain-containing protein [Bacillus paramycoides]MED1091316.1 glycoside hydrolase family 3 C-terminal domain-containing protein [Bacillus paramycoides]MED1103427.1 glycoside hydrolase family 3 C-terminal domain-containing protein [Bacillus paramycoides
MKRDIKKIISQMTLEEKASLCSGLDFWNTKGIERLNIPSIMVTDGPHGLRKQAEGADHLGIYNSIPSTCFPSAVGLASTWNKELIKQVGVALGEECQAENVGVLLGPGANIKRSPLCGRNFEYFSEDPYLSSQMAANHVKGVQSQGIGTSLKHFAANNQEHRRMSVDAIVDERTLREIYLASFEDVIKEAQPWTVMSAYNKINGEYASENNYLLHDILKDEWGFEGFVVSDWGAVNERVESLANGLELEMPSSFGIGEKKIVAAVNGGELSVEKLDQAVERLLNIIFKAYDNQLENAVYSKDAHHQLAREVASESMVMLQNEDSILPLKKEGTVAVIGGFAKQPRYQGGGSSHINPTKLESILEEIETVSGEKTNILFAQGYDLASDDIDGNMINEAKKVAERADTAVLFVGLPDRYESEGFDRKHLQMPENHVQLIEAIAEVQSNIVVVLSNGAPIEMPWIGKVKGILEGYLGGQALGGAIADILFGDANPSGKLAETFPKVLSDNPSYLNFPGEGDKVEYKEGVFVGYRYYDTKNIEPLFPFGFGLSYTNFEYSNLSIDKKEIKDTETVSVRVNVKNTGSTAGKEIVQLYIKDVESTMSRPEKELKGFEKVELHPGEEKTVSFTLNKRSFAYYNVELKDWHVETGEFEILVGKSSKEIVLHDSLYVQSTTIIRKPVHRNTLLGDIFADPILAPLAKELMEKALKDSPFGSMAEGDSDTSEMMEAMLNYMPLRALVNFSAGAFTEEMLSEIIGLLNNAQMNR